MNSNYLKSILMLLNYLNQNKTDVCYIAFVKYSHYEKRSAQYLSSFTGHCETIHNSCCYYFLYSFIVRSALNYLQEIGIMLFLEFVLYYGNY